MVAGTCQRPQQRCPGPGRWEGPSSSNSRAPPHPAGPARRHRPLHAPPQEERGRRAAASRRQDRGAKRGRGDSSGSDSEGSDDDADADGAEPMEAEAAGSGDAAAEAAASDADGGVGAEAAAAIRKAVEEMGAATGGQGSATGVRAVLAGKGVHVSGRPSLAGWPRRPVQAPRAATADVLASTLARACECGPWPNAAPRPPSRPRPTPRSLPTR